MDDVLDWRSVIASVHREHNRVMQLLTGIFGTDLNKKVGALRKLCPDWELHRETLLNHPGLVKEFLDIPEKVFHNIGPLAQDVRSHAQMLKKQELVSNESIKEALRTADMGAETVAFKYVIHHIEEVFPKLESPAYGKAAVES